MTSNRRKTHLSLTAILAAYVLLLGVQSNAQSVASIVSGTVQLNTTNVISVFGKIKAGRTVKDEFRGEGRENIVLFQSLLQIPVSNGKCGKPKIRWVRGAELSKVRAGIERLVKKSKCSASHDGHGPNPNESEFLWHFSIDGSYYLGTYSRSRWFSYLKEIANPDAMYSREWIEEELEGCDAGCSSPHLTAISFVTADYYDRLGRKTTASVWRMKALSESVGSIYFDSVRDSLLFSHVVKLYMFARDNELHGLASWVIALVRSMKLEGEPIDNLMTDMQSWDEIYLGNSSPVGTQFRLQPDTWLNDTDGGMRFVLSRREFTISANPDDVDHAQVTCTRTQTHTLEDQPDYRLVDLKHKHSDGWRIPADWGLCELYILGKTNAPIKVWEYESGGLSETGGAGH